MTDLYGNIPISGESPKKDPSSGKKIKGAQPPTAPKSPKTSAQGKGKFLFIPVTLLLLLITYYGLTTLLIPLYLEKKFPAVFQEKTGLALEFGTVNFNPLKSALILKDINISTLSLNYDKANLLNIESVYLDLDITALIKRGLASESLLIKGALLTITKYDDATYNISRFLPQDSNDSLAFVNLSKVPFLYSLNNIIISESRVLFEDLSNKTTHHLENIQLSLPTLGNFSYKVENYIQPGFSAIINGSPVKLTSDAPYSAAGDQDESSKLSLSLQSINLPLYASYLPTQLPVSVKEGKADIEVEIAFKIQQDDKFHLNLDYRAQIEDGLFESNDSAVTLATPALRLEGTVLPLVRQIKMRSVLLKDPVLTVNESISADTMNTLFLQTDKSEQTRGDFLQSAALDISLLIADNGKCIIQSKNGKRVFHPIQLSIKNFANAKSLIDNPGSKENQSFRLSGESEDNETTFSWQGNFNKTTPTGSLEISNLPADDFLTILSPSTDFKSKGSVAIQGKLSVKRSEQSPLAVLLDHGSAELSSLSLEQNGDSILQSKKVKLSPFRLDEKNVYLGNIFFEGADLQLEKENLKLLANVLNTKTNSVQGIDFKGNVIVEQKGGKNPLKMQNVHLQVNDLEKPKNDVDNFALTATVEKGGTLNAKGKVSIHPFDGEVKIAAADIPATMFISTGKNSRYSLAPTTEVNATGRYDINAESFEGAIEISKGEFTHSQKDTSYTFETAVLDKVSIDQKTGRIKGENVLFKDFRLKNESFSIQTGSLSVSSFTLGEKTTTIDSLEFAKTEITSQKDFSGLFSSLQNDAEDELNISALHMFGSISTANENQQKTSIIDEFNLTITPQKNGESEKKDVELKAHFVDNGRLSANGKMQIHPLQIQVNVILDQVSSKILQHFPSTLGRSQLTTTMSGKVDFTYPETIFAGNILLNEGYVADKTDKPLFSWQKADLQNFKIGDLPLTLEAERLFFDSPQTSFSRDNSSIFTRLQENVAHYLKELNGLSNNNSVSKISIQRVDFNDGSVDYTTSSLSPPWIINLTSVDGYINNFGVDDTKKKTDYSLQGKIGNSAFSLAGSHSPSFDDLENETSLKLTAFPLELMEKQLSTLFNIDFTDSIVDLSFNKQDSAGEFLADLTVTSLDIEDASSTTALTLALISESSDKLSLTIPLKNSSQSLFTQVNNYFQRLIVKCSISPYLLLEWPYDTLKDRNSISFQPGKTELTLESRDTLLDYSTLLEKHPRLQLKLDTTVQRSADTRALREILINAEQKRVQQENDQLLLQWQKQQMGSDIPPPQNGGIAEKDIAEENLAEFTPHTPKEIVITESMLKQLGIDRAEQIRKYILDQSSISENNIAGEIGVSIIDTLDMPEVSIRLGHIGQK